ncbi:histidine kinase [Mycobacterium sp. 852013-51886_SCH5428379]|uniref:PP2C family protein-serine/threonine phosphatase n=1 Tax=Mycobacterium sp. 852013-51886_SCH5428379 TaxID=1834111 RepID=UPI0007FD13D7|nr:SpoIIE family protein phosphatase [Mycobacterium sp. 852013-51886_SCH5428379]OBB56787.1 histidine kinase [Mycobacterium sp. 852013-51886_SCH5428379]
MSAWEALYEDAPCGLVAMRHDRRIASINRTLSTWLGYRPDELIDRTFTDLLTAGSRIHFDTHFAPLLEVSGQLRGITVDLVTAEGGWLPVLLAADLKRDTEQTGDEPMVYLAVHDAQDRRRYERELLAERRRAERERNRAIALAKTLKESLVPPALTPPDGLAAEAHLHAASSDDVGGDFYDLFALSPQRSAFFLGDSCGKGVEAATVASLVRYTIRAAAVFDDDPAAVLRNLNVVLRNRFGSDRSHFCSVIFGLLTRSDDGFEVRLAAGGHPPAILLTAGGDVQTIDTEGGQAAGMIDNAHFVSARLHLRVGDTLVLYTDGLTEARIGRGPERYDDHHALLDFARAHAPTTAASIVAAFRDLLHGLGSGVEDDAAVLALGVPG